MVRYLFLASAFIGLAARGGSVRVTIDAHCDRTIEGENATLNRTKYFGLCHGGVRLFEQCPDAKEAEYILNDLHIAFGRELGLMKSWTLAHKWFKTRGITEDPKRKGYVDPASVADVARAMPGLDGSRMKSRAGIIDVINHGSHDEYPSFMEKYLVKGTDEWIPKNLDAATEYMVAVLRRMPAWARPKYIEPMNEPHWNYPPDKTFQQWHLAIQARLHKEFPQIKVGGPCYCVPYYYKKDFRAFDIQKKFIDGTGGKLDFYSFHPYDYYTGESASVTSGTPMEAVLDLFDNYMRLKYNKPAKLAMSEGGATGKNFAAVYGKRKALPGDVRAAVEKVDPKRMTYAHLAMVHNRALNRYTMTYLANPHVVLKHVPFTLLKTDWNYRYPWALYRRQGLKKGGKLHRTEFFDFYKLWKDVKGRRVAVRSDSPDVMVNAFVDGSTLYLCMQNLAYDDQTVSLDFGKRPISGTTTTYRNDGLIGILTEDAPMKNLNTITLTDDECAIVKLHYAGPIVAAKSIDERVFFGDAIIRKITADVPIRFSIGVDHPAKIQYATLRVSVSRKLGLRMTPKVVFNGTPMTVKLEQAYRKRKKVTEYVALKQIDIPPALIKSTNTIQVSFPDSGGAIGTVALRAGLRR